MTVQYEKGKTVKETQLKEDEDTDADDDTTICIRWTPCGSRVRKNMINLFS